MSSKRIIIAESGVNESSVVRAQSGICRTEHSLDGVVAVATSEQRPLLRMKMPFLPTLMFTQLADFEREGRTVSLIPVGLKVSLSLSLSPLIPCLLILKKLPPSLKDRSVRFTRLLFSR